MVKPVYKKGTLLSSILWDGWSRGFNVAQTYIEIRLQGYYLSYASILIYWARLESQFIKTHLGDQHD